MHRVIHPNRWFFWTISILIGTGLVLLIMINLTSQYFEKQAVELVRTQNVGWKSFRSQSLGLSVRYPSTWQVEIDPLEKNNVTFENPQNFTDNITIAVLVTKQEQATRDIFRGAKETKITVDGEPASRFSSAATADSVLVKHSGRLYYISGEKNYLEKFIDNVRFLE